MWCITKLITEEKGFSGNASIIDCPANMKLHKLTVLSYRKYTAS